MFLYIVFCFVIRVVFFYFLLDLCGAVCSHLNVTGSFMQRMWHFHQNWVFEASFSNWGPISGLNTSGRPTEKEWEPAGTWPGFGHMCFAVTVQNQHLRLHLPNAPFLTQQRGTCRKSRLRFPPQSQFYICHPKFTVGTALPLALTWQHTVCPENQR